MSDTVVSFALESLRDLLIHEVNLLPGVKEQVDLLKDDLGFMNSFLKDSEGKQNEHYMVKELISQIRDAAFQAEDVISIYMAHTTRIKNKIDNIYANKSRFGIEAGSHSHLDEEAERLLEQRRRDVEEVDVVGLANDTTTMVDQLTDGRSLGLEVTSIIGMGGLGKTTLARKIYKNSRIKNHFDCCAWVNVSQEYKTRRLLLDMMKKKYFVVMDDVWKPEVWDQMKAAFPDESNGSRLLITSREKDVATHSSSTPPYSLPFLDDDASWELFSTSDSLSVRSVLSFHLIVWYNRVAYVKWILKHFRFIRVLSLEKVGTYRSIIPKGIEKLIFLRYLRISSSDDDKDDDHALSNLQVLSNLRVGNGDAFNAKPSAFGHQGMSFIEKSATSTLEFDSPATGRGIRHLRRVEEGAQEIKMKDGCNLIIF
ncbi:hypothetical protein FEM48_Zijuj12G0188400 [Ziziphus jujuba var. spinosa]|uniref:Disease resistance RPP13-like protein 3 n=1 Tax=Ziziphus jujuba var. spinosa TaxID=714518 RepID=A0A978UEY4_ZIZJJ|nr:hypothetical protein FEM48_Zijuj12G0188400 [Ziziphus jujuba var. spinosa]